MENLKKGIDFIGVTVTFLCHDGKGNYVMAKRSVNARDEQGKWDTGGGALEFGQTIEGTLRKEIKEEYNLGVVSFEPLGVRDVHRVQNGINTHWIALDHKVLVNPDNLKINEPHKFDEIGWYTLDQMLGMDNLHSQLGPALEKYKDKL